MIELKENYEKGMRKLKQVDAVFCLGLLALGLICLFSRHWLVALFSNKSYARAADVLPFITFGYVVGGGYKVVSSVLSFHGRVWYMPIVSILAFGFGGCMNWLLIPRFNEIGAGYATFLGLFAYSYIQHLFGSRYYVRLAPITAIYAAVLAGVTLLFFRMTGLL
jgi:O-antigen/teichoic acid export membrane protein